LVIVTINESNQDKITGLLKINKIGIWNVSCRLPISKIISCSVIGPFGEDVTDLDVTQCLVEAGYMHPKATRIYKGYGKIKTSMFKIILELSELPEYIYIGYQCFKVKLFIDSPWQCFKCQRFGHSAAFCNSKQKCVVCAGPHMLKDCTNRSPKCSNCGGPHTASYGGCKSVKEAKLVEQVRAVDKISYRDALTKVKNQNKVSDSQLNNEYTSQHNKTYQISHSNMHAASTSVNSPIANTEKKTINASVQTETPEQGIQTCSLMGIPIVQLTALIWQLLTIKNTIGNDQQFSAITSMMEKIIGSKVDKNQMLKLFPNMPFECFAGAAAAATTSSSSSSSSDVVLHGSTGCGVNVIDEVPGDIAEDGETVSKKKSNLPAPITNKNLSQNTSSKRKDPSSSPKSITPSRPNKRVAGNSNITVNNNSVPEKRSKFAEQSSQKYTKKNHNVSNTKRNT
jgi:hypothetical protein